MSLVLPSGREAAAGGREPLVNGPRPAPRPPLACPSPQRHMSAPFAPTLQASEKAQLQAIIEDLERKLSEGARLPPPITKLRVFQLAGAALIYNVKTRRKQPPPPPGACIYICKLQPSCGCMPKLTNAPHP